MVRSVTECAKEIFDQFGREIAKVLENRAAYIEHQPEETANLRSIAAQLKAGVTQIDTKNTDIAPVTISPTAIAELQGRGFLVSDLINHGLLTAVPDRAMAYEVRAPGETNDCHVLNVNAFLRGLAEYKESARKVG